MMRETQLFCERGLLGEADRRGHHPELARAMEAFMRASRLADG